MLLSRLQPSNGIDGSEAIELSELWNDYEAKPAFEALSEAGIECTPSSTAKRMR